MREHLSEDRAWAESSYGELAALRRKAVELYLPLLQQEHHLSRIFGEVEDLALISLEHGGGFCQMVDLASTEVGEYLYFREIALLGTVNSTT